MSDFKSFCDHKELPIWNFYCREPLGPSASLYAVGDIGFSGRIGKAILENTDGNPFQELAPMLKTGDIVFGNLETPLLKSWETEKMFAGAFSNGKRLKEAGFTLVHVANNHIYDYGPNGLASTLDACQNAGLKPLGAGKDQQAAKRMCRTDIHGIKIGWLGCGRTLKRQNSDGPIYWEYDQEELLQRMETSHANVDVLIVSIHIGYMYVDYPDPAHKCMAEKLIDYGADLILMHHAHILQGIQTYKNGIICYNLGDFLFDWQEGNVKVEHMFKQQRQGGVFVFGIDQSGISSVSFVPTYVDDQLTVRWARGSRGWKILERLKRISEDLSGNYLPFFQQQRVQRNTDQSLKVVWFHLQHGNWSILRAYLAGMRLRHVMMLIRLVLSKLRKVLNAIL